MPTFHDPPWIRPVLRWAGSKRKLLPKLIACQPPKFDRYIEPFLGSACLYLALQPDEAILGDFNKDLIAMYSFLRRYPREIARRLHELPDTSEFYYDLRSKQPNQLSGIDSAVRFIYLNRHCFNGVYRANRHNQFNVPRGKQTGKLPGIEEIVECGRAFRGTQLIAGDFEKTIADARASDFVYLDPPYASVSRLDHGEYGYESFGEKDISRLVSALKELDDRGATVLLSYAYTPRMIKQLPGWHFKYIRVRRYVGGFGDRRSIVREILASNRPLPGII